ncbi:MAG: LytTR family DNA-binding domain-containing protein [Gemmatimonadota bacterium]
MLIVDDERIARDGLRGLLLAEPDIEVVGEVGDGRAAVDAILRGNVECCLLDVQMPEMDGFDVLRSIPEEKLPVVIFITAYDQHAVRAFEAQALDYVVKPFTDARFHKAMARARQQVYQRRVGAATTQLAEFVASLTRARQLPDADRVAPRRHLARIPVRSLGKTAYVRVDDVLWIGAADYYSELHTSDGRKHVVRETMRNLEQRLDPGRFIRVHRSAIVNIDCVVEVRTDKLDRHVVVLRSGARVPLGRGRRAALEELLSKR